MTDHAAAAQKAAEDHLEACYAAMSEFEEALVQGGGDVVEDPSWGPFCGCATCVVREVLHAAYPHLLELAREEAAAPAEPRRDETTTDVDTISIFELLEDPNA